MTIIAQTGDDIQYKPYFQRVTKIYRLFVEVCHLGLHVAYTVSQKTTS